MAAEDGAQLQQQALQRDMHGAEALPAAPPAAPAAGAAGAPVLDHERIESLSRETATKLREVWDELGLSEEERTRQLGSLIEAVEQVFVQKVTDECALRDEYINAAVDLEKEINEISEQLGMERNYFPGGNSGNLMLKLTWLRSHLVDFKNVKAERLSTLNDMKEKLVTIWNELGHAREDDLLEVENFLTLDGIDEYESRLATAQSERMRRIAAIQETIRDITELYDDLDYDITTDLDRSIAQGGESLGINLDAVTMLSKRARELTEEKIARTEQLKKLGAAIQPLWELLDVDADYRSKFFLENVGIGLGVVHQCELELKRLEQLKQVRMGDLIRTAQEKIVALWDEMQYSDEQREDFTKTYIMGPICEETLRAHDQEIDALNVQLELYRPILKTIEKYFQLCEERTDYEEKIKDSSRLLSRRGGSALREEEQQRLRVTKGIPRVIERVQTIVAEYEEVHGAFVLNGQRFLDTLDENEAAHKEKLEQEKLEKQRQKSQSNLLMQTPLKTPKKTPMRSGGRPPLSLRNE